MKLFAIILHLVRNLLIKDKKPESVTIQAYILNIAINNTNKD